MIHENKNSHAATHVENNIRSEKDGTSSSKEKGKKLVLDGLFLW